MDRAFDCKPKLQESSPALPAQPETPHDGHLAGLLTYASGELEAPSRVISRVHANIRRKWRPFPVACRFKFSAITVAGQWRILTALPITRRREVIDESGDKVKGYGNWVNVKFGNLKTSVQEPSFPLATNVVPLVRFSITQLPNSFIRESCLTCQA